MQSPKAAHLVPVIAEPHIRPGDLTVLGYQAIYAEGRTAVMLDCRLLVRSYP